MRKPGLMVFVALPCLLITAAVGCGPSHGGSAGVVPSTAPVSLTVTDAPPSGVTLLSSQFTITGAAMQPGNVSLVGTNLPVPIEFAQLQTQAAFLSATNVAVGTYTSLTVTFSNPHLTIQNNSGAAIGACANGAICQLTPAATTVSVTFSSTPFPITLTQNTPVGFQLDINLNNAIQSDLSVNLNAPSAVTVTQLPATQLTGTLQELADVRGAVQSAGTNQFVLKTGPGFTLTITTDSNTTFSFTGSACTTNNFSCIAVGQILGVSLRVLGNGNLLAESVKFEQPSGQQQVLGTIAAISTASGVTSIQLVVHDESPSIANISVGNVATVTLKAGAGFSVDSGSFTIPGGLNFLSASDLVAGQEVLVHVSGAIVVTPALAFSTDSITLEPSQLTATVNLINIGAINFSVNNLPGLFTNALPTPITQILVQTTTQTTFESLSPLGLTGLAVGNRVSAEGWLFNTPSGSTPATMAGKKVRGRPSGG